MIEADEGYFTIEASARKHRKQDVAVRQRQM